MELPADLPNDIDALKALLRASEARNAERDTQVAERDAVIERKEDRIIRLEKLVVDFKRALFEAKSEKTDPDQYQLALEDIETCKLNGIEPHAYLTRVLTPSPRGANKTRLKSCCHGIPVNKFNIGNNRISLSTSYQ